MGLGGYRTYREKYIDTGMEVPEITISQKDFVPNFKNQNTLQVWNISGNLNAVNVSQWVKDTLADRSVHTIQIINNVGGKDVPLRFDNMYYLEDDIPDFTPDKLPELETTILIRSGETAFFYATAYNKNNNIILALRKGTQDTREEHPIK